MNFNTFHTINLTVAMFPQYFATAPPFPSMMMILCDTIDACMFWYKFLAWMVCPTNAHPRWQHATCFGRNCSMNLFVFLQLILTYGVNVQATLLPRFVKLPGCVGSLPLLSLSISMLLCSSDAWRYELCMAVPWPFIIHVLNSSNCAWASFPDLPSLLYFGLHQYMEVEEWQGRSASIHHMDDVKWTWGGHGEGVG